MIRNSSIGILVFILCTFSVHAQIPYLKELEISRDGSTIKINRIYQDQQHFVWIGTSEGLFRYDGYNFQKIQGSDSVSNPSVKAVMRDEEGRLWIGYEDGPIRIFQNNRLSEFHPQEGVPKVSITDFAQDSSGNIWFSTYGEGLYVLAQDHIYNFNTDDGLTDNFVYSITVCKNGNVWCGTDEGLSICSWKNGKKSVARLSQPQGLPDNIVRCVRTDSCGKIWVGMQDKGLCYFDLDSNHFVVPANLAQWDYGAVTSICLLSHNELWAGTEKSGIADVELFGAMRVRGCGNVSGMSANRINDLIQDAEGNMWIAANTTLLFSPGEKIEFMHSVNGIAFTDIQSILHRKNGELWLSTPRDLWAINLNDENGKTIRKVFEKNQLGASSILCMYEDPYSNVWIGTFGQGVFWYESKSGALKNIREADGLANDNVLSIAGKGNDVWFATLGGVSRCTLIGDQGHSALQTFTEQTGLKANYVYNVFIDSKNRVWFGTDGNGITVYENKEFRNYSKETGLKSNVIYSITEDSHGTIWFSTRDAGIYSFDGKNFYNYSLNDGLSETDISSLKADDNGNIIIVNDHGIDVMQTANHHFLYFGQESNISEIEPNLNASFKDDDGNIWLGTKSGIVKIRMPSGMVDARPFTVLNGVKIFLKDIDEKGKPVFNYKENHVSFDYAGLYFSNPEKVIYEYKLDGYNPEWIKTHDRFITFPNLRPGSYNFHVRSALGNQFDSAAIMSFPFTIKNPFWQEPWFYLLVFVLIVLAVYFFIKIRERNLRREEQLKKEHIEFQFETLKSQINPHFLFNSFNTLAALIDENRDVAIEYVDNLSDFYRSILAYKDVDVISLKEEWQLLMNYVYLLQQRHGGSFNLIDAVEKKRQDLFLPPLTLQMLVENAVKHNVVSQKRPLIIRIFMKDEETLVVENNLQPKSQQPVSTKFGLRSISDRFEYLGGKPISIEQTFDKYHVEITLIKKLTHHESTHY